MSEGFILRPCAMCDVEHLNYADYDYPVCFDCSHQLNEYAAKNIKMSVDASCDDSTLPARVRDGTADKNLGLPPVQGDPIGRNAYGQMKHRMRPVANSEIGSARRLREMSKRAGLTQLESAKRAVGSP